MTTCLEKSCPFSLLYLAFVGVCYFVCASFHFGFEGGMWDLNVLVPDHCLSFYLDILNGYP